MNTKLGWQTNLWDSAPFMRTSKMLYLYMYTPTSYCWSIELWNIHKVLLTKPLNIMIKLAVIDTDTVPRLRELRWHSWTAANKPQHTPGLGIRNGFGSFSCCSKQRMVLLSSRPGGMACHCTLRTCWLSVSQFWLIVQPPRDHTSCSILYSGNQTFRNVYVHPVYI